MKRGRPRVRHSWSARCWSRTPQFPQIEKPLERDGLTRGFQFNDPRLFPLSTYCLSFWLLADRGTHFLDQLWGKFLHAVCSPAVLRTLVQNFLFSCTASFKVAVHAYFPASNDLCHVGLQMIYVSKKRSSSRNQFFYCLSYTIVLFTFSPLAFVPFWVVVRVFPSFETTLRVVTRGFPPFLLTLSTV